MNRVSSFRSVMSRTSPIGSTHDELLRIRLGKSGRARLESEFQIHNTTRGYEELLTDMLATKRR